MFSSVKLWDCWRGCQERKRKWLKTLYSSGKWNIYIPESDFIWPLFDWSHTHKVIFITIHSRFDWNVSCHLSLQWHWHWLWHLSVNWYTTLTITCFPDDAPLCVLILSNTTYRRPHLVSSWCCCCWANWYCDPALNAQNQQGFQIQQNEDIWSIADNILPSLRFSQTVGGIPVFSEFLSSYTCTGCGLECSVLRVILSYTFCPRKYER